MTTTVEKSIDVEVPLGAAYNQWTQFEEFPRFMEGVDSVLQVDDVTLHWSADIAGVHREWDAVILDQKPDRRVSWMSTSGAKNAGTVTFEKVSPYVTRVNLELEFEPEGFVESVGDTLGMVERRANGDLERFKEFIEARGASTGGWRGEVQGATVVDPEDKPGW